MRSPGSVPWGPSWERLSFLFVLLLWTLARALQVKYLGTGVGYDVGLYQQYAQQWGSGAAAYVDFHPEYPPGALLVFLLPLLWGGAANYTQAFAAEMACFDLAACLLVLRYSQIDAPRGSLRPLLASLLYIAVTAALFPVLHSRYDLVPGALVLAAVYSLRVHRVRRAAVLLGIAGCVKLWPFALVPVFAVWEARRKGLRHVLVTGVWVFVGALAAALPLLPRAGVGVFEFFKYHAARGIQLETTWATAALVLSHFGIAKVQPEHNFGAFHVAGRLPSVFAALSLPLTVLFALAPQVVALVHRLRHPERGTRTPEHVVFATVLGFMIAGKVLSPQFMLWIVPLLPLVAEGFGGFLLALAMAGLTTAVYPYLSPALEQRAVGHGWALLAVGMRNLLLIGWYCAFFFREFRPQK